MDIIINMERLDVKDKKKDMIARYIKLIGYIEHLDDIALETYKRNDTFDNSNYMFSEENNEVGMDLLVKASNLADEIFISDQGQVIYDNIAEFYEIKKNSEYFNNNNIEYDIYPIEQDQFGWLIGGIKTQKGVIVFG
jgi:galactose-1-phosphate uridylyltransferase